MERFHRALISLVRDESGATLAEYSIVMAVLSIGMIAAYTVVGNMAANNASTNETNFTSSSIAAP